MLVSTSWKLNGVTGEVNVTAACRALRCFKVKVLMGFNVLLSFFGVRRTDLRHIVRIGRTGKYEEAKGYATIESLPQVNDHTTDGVETIVYVNVSHYKIDRPQPPSSLVHVILLACDVVFSTLIVVRWRDCN
ncbi:hypothetical protein Tco_0327770 [Tanacetum coccineum]